MKKFRGQRGFTLHELLIVLAIFAILAALAICVVGSPMANIWISEEGILKAVKLIEPSSEEILSIQRNVVSYSLVTVRNRDGSLSVYEVDSNILFNYRLRKVSKR